MNRLSFVTNQKMKKVLGVVETLRVGSVWKSRESRMHTRIRRYGGIDKGKYYFVTETCGHPRWYKINKWTPFEWRVDEIYLRHDFPRLYEKAVFVEPLTIFGRDEQTTGFSRDQSPPNLILFLACSSIAGAIISALYSHPIVAGILTPIGLFGFWLWLCVREVANE